MTDEKKKSGLLNSLIELLESVLLAVLVTVLCTTFLFRFNRVSGESMEDTLYDKDMLIVRRIMYEPERYDIVVLYSEYLDELCVKRVIGLEGERVEIDYENGVITVDDDVIAEDYTKYHALDEVVGFDMSFYDEASKKYVYEVPEGCVFVLGDNRNNSADSRTIGFIDKEDISGKVIFRLWSEKAKAGTVE